MAFLQMRHVYMQASHPDTLHHDVSRVVFQVGIIGLNANRAPVSLQHCIDNCHLWNTTAGQPHGIYWLPSECLEPAN